VELRGWRGINNLESVFGNNAVSEAAKSSGFEFGFFGCGLFALC